MGKIKKYFLEKQREKCGIFQKKRFIEENCSNLKTYPLRKTCKGSGWLIPNKTKSAPKNIIHTDLNPQYNYIKKYCMNCPYYKYSKIEKGDE